MQDIDLIQVAQKLLDELHDNSIRNTYRAEGIRIFINRLRELEAGNNEQGNLVDGRETGQTDPTPVSSGDRTDGSSSS